MGADMQLALFPEVGVTMPPKIPSLYEQLMSCAAHAASDDRKSSRHWEGHIRGAGVVRGSATDEVHRLMLDTYPRTWSQGELMSRTGRERGAVGWALHYLSAIGLIKTFGDARNQRYQRYQAIPDAVVSYANC